MDSSSYLAVLKERYSHYYNVFEERDRCAPWQADLIAEYNVRHEKSAFTRKLVLYAQEECEYCFVRVCDKPLAVSDALDFADRIKKNLDRVVKPHAEHVKTVLTGVLISDQGCEPGVAAAVKKFRYSKSFKLYLHGWCEIRIIAVDLLAGALSHNLGRRSRFTNQLLSFYGFFHTSGSFAVAITGGEQREHSADGSAASIHHTTVRRSTWLSVLS